MSVHKNDPIGLAIQDFAKNNYDENIIVSSNICDDDIIPVELLFRPYEKMPKIEQFALSLCSGKVLDVGAAAGVHAAQLNSQGIETEAIDISPGAVNYMRDNNINAHNVDFFNVEKGNYDTLLMLMNGIGIAGTLSNLDATLLHAKKLVTVRGKILCDSTDIKYLYADDDGGMWVDLSSEYYGNFQFQMHYRDQKTPIFDWLYVDFENLRLAGERTGWKVTKRFEEGDHFLAELKRL